MTMIISVINMSDRALDDADLQAGIPASKPQRLSGYGD